VPGTTASGVPWEQRGRIAFDTAMYTDTSGRDGAAGANVIGTLPLADRTFFETVVPLSIGFPVGNIMLGAHHVAKLGSSRLWFTGGGQLGIPLAADDAFVIQSVPRAFWNLPHYMDDVLPLLFRMRLEYHTDLLELRAELEPSVWFPLGNKDEIEGAFPHAVELQLGHGVGGGLRLQGVVVGPGNDQYQAALSPFFAIRRELGFARVGIMFPLDETLGPAFEERRAWGALVATGLHID